MSSKIRAVDNLEMDDVDEMTEQDINEDTGFLDSQLYVREEHINMSR